MDQASKCQVACFIALLFVNGIISENDTHGLMPTPAASGIKNSETNPTLGDSSQAQKSIMIPITVPALS